MVRYPSTNSKDFYHKINQIYKNYKIVKSNKTEQELCYPKEYLLQNPQKFVAQYINPDTPYTDLLVFHQIGAGKTCASIQIAEQWKHSKHIIVATPASLIGNFRKELRTDCVKNQYITKNEQNILKKNNPTSQLYKAVIKKTDKIIDKYYTVISHQKLMAQILDKSLTFKNNVLIIDEIQNLISEYGNYYKLLYSFMTKIPKTIPVILLSGTPMFNSPLEIALTMNLLRLSHKIPHSTKTFNKMFLVKYKDKKGEIFYKAQNLDILAKLLKGYVSYFKGADPKTFPKKKVINVKCQMKELQYRSYLTVNDKAGSFKNADIMDMPQHFFIGSRSISNIAYPNKRMGQEGFESFKNKYLKGEHLRQCSEKFYQIIKNIQKSKGPVFVYSNFKDIAGLKPFIKVLEAYGFVNYKKGGKGKMRFAIWSGDEKALYKEEIKNIFNNPNNINGDNIKILLGSPSIKEGVSLLRVEQVHIMEPYWNVSRLDQIIGRAIRYCSHKDVDKSRKFVNIFMYFSVHPKEKVTIDEYIYELALKKQYIINQFERLLKETSVDCLLNKVANTDKDNKLKCYK